MKTSGQVLLRGAWISSEDLHLNRIMRERRTDKLCKVLSAVVVVALIAFAVVVAW